MTDEKPFTCPRCGYEDRVFHQVCPECGRPYFRDYIDTRDHPQDPDLTGVCKGQLYSAGTGSLSAQFIWNFLGNISISVVIVSEISKRQMELNA